MGGKDTNKQCLTVSDYRINHMSHDSVSIEWEYKWSEIKNLYSKNYNTQPSKTISIV